ncbi:sodium-dependent transporter, partial [Biomphalaria glabrata]
MFTPHWDSFSNPRVWVDAVTQNAFDTGAGAGLLIPYAAYMSKHHGIVRYATVVPTVNNLVSLISGITIFSTVFSSLIASTPYVTNSDIVGIIKDSGPGSTGLTFIWIPVLFESVGVFGRVLACLFFLCLSLAGLTSIIASFELFTHTLVDFNLRRPFAILINTCLIFGFGMLSATNINILTNQDFVWSFALIINGFMLIILVFQVGVRNFRERVINSFGSDDWRLNIAWEWIIA